MLILTALLWVLLMFHVGGAQSTDDPVACNFNEDLCNWRQDDLYDLTDWERVDEGYIIVKIIDSVEQTLARLYSGEFSYSNSPEISLEYKINGSYTSNGENTKLQVLVMHDGMTFMAESDSSGSDDWQRMKFTIDGPANCTV